MERMVMLHAGLRICNVGCPKYDCDAFLCITVFFVGDKFQGIFRDSLFLCRKEKHINRKKKGRHMEEKRIAVLGIIIEDVRQAEQVNALLHQFGSYIIGRMGIPYKEKQLNIISIVVDAPADVISALSGKLGRLPGVSSKALYSKTGSGQGGKRKEEPRGVGERKNPGE